MTEDVVPCSGVLGPQGSANAEQEAMGQVEERRGGRQHLLHGPDELLRLQGGRWGEEADTLPVQHMATCWTEGGREGGGREGGRDKSQTFTTFSYCKFKLSQMGWSSHDLEFMSTKKRNSKTCFSERLKSICLGHSKKTFSIFQSQPHTQRQFCFPSAYTVSEETQDLIDT